jgi:hypothetical protein
VRRRRRPLPGGGAVSGGRGVVIALTDGQLAQVLREAPPQLASLLPEVSQLDARSSVVLALLEDERFSRTTLRALLVLSALPADGSERELTHLARELGISPSTTHRYIHTWMALGLIEQNPRSRRYYRTLAIRSSRERAVVGGGDAG